MTGIVYGSKALNQDSGQINTAMYNGDVGDGTSDKWYEWMRIADGGFATAGLKADAAVTNPALSASMIGALKGILTGINSAVTSLGSLATLVTSNSKAATGIMKAEDEGHLSGDYGVAVWGVKKATAAASSGTDLDYEPFQMDALGRLRVAAVRDPSGGHPSVLAMSALAASLLVKATPGNLQSIIGYSTTAQFLQVHNTTSLPANGVVPLVSVPIAANTVFNIPFPDLPCSVGIVICNSTTGATKTIGGADTFLTAVYD